MNSLDKIYLELLNAGLLAIRETTSSGDFEWCKVEAEHLHNIPMLIGRDDRGPHLSYVATQRTEYIGWLRRHLERKDILAFVHVRYMPLWKEMDTILGLSDEGDGLV